MWQRASPGVGHPQIAPEVGPARRESAGGSLLGGQEVTTAGPTFGSLDSFFLPAVPSRCPWPGPPSGCFPCQDFATFTSQLSHTRLVRNNLFNLFLASCLRLPLKSELLQEVSLGVRVALCPLFVPTPGQDSGLLRFSPPCPSLLL